MRYGPSPCHGDWKKGNVKNVHIQPSAIMCDPLIECVGVDKPGCGAEDHQEVTQGDGRQDRVCGGQHRGSEVKRILKI